MSDEQAARFRVRVVGQFTSRPGGRRFTVSASTFADALAQAGLAARVTVDDRLAGGKRTFELTFGRTRSFQLAEVVATTPVLTQLRTLADDLGRSPAPTAESTLSRARELLGEGALVEALKAVFAPPAPAGAGASIDDVLAGGTRSSAAGAVDAIVRGMKPAGEAPPRGARAARKAIEDAVYATAADLLRDPAVTRLDSAWRGLKLLADQCSSGAAASIEVVDVTPESLLDGLTADLPDDEVDRPDLFVVVDPCDDAAVLGRLAEEAERACAPAIVAVSMPKEDVDPGEVWRELRAVEASRWLCAATNRVAACEEGQGPARRQVFTSPALGLAAMVMASFRDTRSFARILGANGALKAPATCEAPTGRDSMVTAPTETFCSIQRQQALAAAGVLGLGSARNSTRLMLSLAPMVRGAKDVLPLPAQILAGRIVRFASWARGQIPPGASDQEAATLFEEAAKVFLFVGLDGAQLRAGVGRSEGGARVVEIAASLRAEHASLPFQMAFTLPL